MPISYSRYIVKSLINVSVLITLLSSTTFIWAGGSTEKTSVDNTPQEDTNKTNILEDTPTELLYEIIPSNYGILYKFYETTPLPQNAAKAILSIQNMDSDTILKQYSISLTPKNNATFEYVVNPSGSTFYPLLPLVAILTVFDNTGTLLYPNQTNFTAELSLTPSITNPDLYMSNPILFSNDQDSIFSELYNNDDQVFTTNLIEKLEESLVSYLDEEKEIHLLITGLSFINTNNYYSSAYEQLFKKIKVVREELIKNDSVLFKNIEIYFDILLNHNNKGKVPLYHTQGQFIISISNDINIINSEKKTHVNNNILFIKEASKSLFTQYADIKNRLDSAMINIISAEENYVQTLNMITSPNLAAIRERADHLDEEIIKWSTHINKIITTFQTTREKVNQINTNTEEKSMINILSELNNSSISDPTLFSNINALKEDYNITYQRILDIDREYNKRYSYISLLKDTLDGYINMLEEFNKQVILNDNIVQTEDNLFLLNGFPKSIKKIKTIADHLLLMLADINNNNLDFSIMLKMFHEIPDTLNSLESLLNTVSNTISKNQITKNNLFLPIQLEEQPHQESINNTISNINIASEEVKNYNIKSFNQVKEIYENIEDIVSNYLRLESIIYPIIQTSDSDIMKNAMNVDLTIASTTHDTNNYTKNITPNSVFVEENNQSELNYDIKQNPLASDPSINDLSLEKEKNSSIHNTSQPANISNNYNIIGSNTLSTNHIIAYIQSKQITPAYDINQLITTYMREASIEDINAEIAIAQMLYTTRMLEEKKFFNKNNPAGIGGPSKNWELYPFHNLETGIRAHIQHLKAYASIEPLNSDIVDPRYLILKRKDYLGTAPTLTSLTKKWYSANSLAQDQIYSILKEMRVFTITSSDKYLDESNKK